MQLHALSHLVDDKSVRSCVVCHLFGFPILDLEAGFLAIEISTLHSGVEHVVCIGRDFLGVKKEGK